MAPGCPRLSGRDHNSASVGHRDVDMMIEYDRRRRDSHLNNMIGFHASAPLVTTSGHRLGHLSVIDPEPRDNLSDGQRQGLLMLAKQAVAHLEMRHALFVAARKNARLVWLNQQKNTLVGMVSHDLRQPLTSIMVCSELLLRDEAEQRQRLSAQQMELVNTVGSCARFMHHLTDDLLHMAESDFCQKPIRLDCRLTDLVALVRRAVSVNAASARCKNISLCMRIEPSRTAPPKACNASGHGLQSVNDGKEPGPEQRALEGEDEIKGVMDEARIEQVLNNLIGNAIKYSYPGGHVEVAVGKTAVAGSSSSSSRVLFVMFQPEDFEEWAGTSLYKSTSATVSVDGLHHTSDGSLIPLD